MALQPPTGPLWQQVQARRPDLWPVDNEEAAAELATVLAGMADSVSTAGGETARSANLTSAAWTDDPGTLMSADLTAGAGQMADFATRVQERSAGTQAYATELAGAKTDILATVAANEPTFTALGALPPPFGAHFQGVFADMVANDLGTQVERRIAAVGQIQLPAPPSHEELLADPRFQVADDPSGAVYMFGMKMSRAERDEILGMWPHHQAQYAGILLTSSITGTQVFPDTPADGDQDNRRDAYRHALIYARATHAFGYEQSRELGDLHESIPGNLPAREAMDLYNNEVGRQIALENPDADEVGLSRLIQQAVRDGRMVVLHDGRLVPSSEDF